MVNIVHNDVRKMVTLVENVKHVASEIYFRVKEQNSVDYLDANTWVSTVVKIFTFRKLKVNVDILLENQAVLNQTEVVSFGRIDLYDDERKDNKRIVALENDSDQQVKVVIEIYDDVKQKD